VCQGEQCKLDACSGQTNAANKQHIGAALESGLGLKQADYGKFCAAKCTALVRFAAKNSMNSVRFWAFGAFLESGPGRKAQAVRRACRVCDWLGGGRRGRGGTTGRSGCD
jgi:hypothetical protein